MRGWRVTGLGWVVIVMLLACGLLVTVGSGAVRSAAAAVGGIVLLLIVAEGLSGPGDNIGSSGRKAETLRRDRFGDGPPPPEAR
jgi:hypothetical protein